MSQQPKTNTDEEHLSMYKESQSALVIPNPNHEFKCILKTNIHRSTRYVVENLHSQNETYFMANEQNFREKGKYSAKILRFV